MKSLLASITLLSLAFTISGCNTMEGVGKDIKAGGEKLKKSADRNKSS